MKKAINRLLSATVAAAMLFSTAISGVSAAEIGTYDAVALTLMK